MNPLGKVWFWLLILSIIGFILSFIFFETTGEVSPGGGTTPSWVWVVFILAIVLLIVAFIFYAIDMNKQRRELEIAIACGLLPPPKVTECPKIIECPKKCVETKIVDCPKDPCSNDPCPKKCVTTKLVECPRAPCVKPPYPCPTEVRPPGYVSHPIVYVDTPPSPELHVQPVTPRHPILSASEHVAVLPPTPGVVMQEHQVIQTHSLPPPSPVQIPSTRVVHVPSPLSETSPLQVQIPQIQRPQVQIPQVQVPQVQRPQIPQVQRPQVNREVQMIPSTADEIDVPPPIFPPQLINPPPVRIPAI